MTLLVLICVYYRLQVLKFVLASFYFNVGVKYGGHDEL